jgi:hypothetical protein
MQTKENRNNDSNELEVNFIANAGIKDIVGRGLIYNDNVAIIELIKNDIFGNISVWLRRK